MEFLLPNSPGWSAMHLMNAEWGKIALIVKREYLLDSGQGTLTPRDDVEGLIVADTIEPTITDDEDRPVVRRGADLALFTAHADLIYLGVGTEALDPHGVRFDTAAFRVDGVARRSFTRPSPAFAPDPVNLFGYHPKADRLSPPYDPATFDFAAQGASLFRAARRDGGYSVSNGLPALAGDLDIRVETTSSGSDTDPFTGDVIPDVVAEFSLSVPDMVAIPFVWEGGKNSPAYWCRRAPVALKADTLTIEGDRVSLIWRGALPLSEVPAPDLRQVNIQEAA